MNNKADGGLFWVEETDGQVYTPKKVKRKVRSKKKEYVGWGSRSLIGFLESIGKDTAMQISQYDVTTIINDYVKDNSLLHPTKKKRIVCDEKLHLLFGRKTIARVKIHDLLESHFAQNCDESSDDSLFNSEDDENTYLTCEILKTTTSEKKTQSKKRFTDKPKSCFAAIIPSNLKLVYLKRSLVEHLLKDPETFESKVVGSLVRIRCDPNDYLQKNSHQLLQVTGIKKSFGMNDVSAEILIQLSGYIKDVTIPMLSDDNFSEEECEDLHKRVKDGLLKRPMIVDLEQKARALHEDMTKHWLVRELALLQNLIDQANEKGWRKELYEYLDRREKLKTPDEQARLLRDIPQVVADDLESESTTMDVPGEKMEDRSHELQQAIYEQTPFMAQFPVPVADGLVPEATTLDILNHVKQEGYSPKSILIRVSEVPLSDMATSGTVLYRHSHGTGSAEPWRNIHVQQQPEQQMDLICKVGASESAGSDEANVSPKKLALPSQVIELSDDEGNEEPSSLKQIPAELLESLIWHYRDPQGEVQGPFSITSLKRWSDARYFPSDFMVWKAGQSPSESLLLVDILQQLFPS